MKVILCYQDVWDLMKNGLTPISDNATDEQRVAHKYLKKKDYKSLFIIHLCVDPYNFEIVSDVG